MSRPKTHNNQTRSFSAVHGSSLCAFHLLWTRLEVQCHRGYVMSLVVGRRSGVRSVVGFGRCILQRREESKPIYVSLLVPRWIGDGFIAHPHGRIQSACDLIFLLQPWATSQNLWQPELANGTLHVPNLPLRWRRCFDPLRWLSSDSTYHVSMSKSFGCPLVRFDVEGRRYGLCDAGMEGGVSTGDHKRVFAMIACGRSISVPISSSRTWGKGVSD